MSSALLSMRSIRPYACTAASTKFLTIEGGMGFWTSSQFPTISPKYRINGVPDCYTTQLGSPGWPFGGTTALSDAEMVLAPPSNPLLVPPDGMPFAAGAEAKRLGLAW